MKDYRIVIIIAEQETPWKTIKTSLEFVPRNKLLSALADAPLELMVRALAEGKEGSLA